MKADKAILCVDDDAIILLSLKQEILSSFNGKFIIETALNADIALEIIDDLYKDGIKVILIITDWLMRGMKGDEFLMIVRNKFEDIKFIIISGQSDDIVIENAFIKIGLCAYIKKPWSNDHLINTIRKCVESA